MHQVRHACAADVVFDYDREARPANLDLIVVADQGAYDRPGGTGQDLDEAGGDGVDYIGYNISTFSEV